MSMIYILRQASDATVKVLLNDPGKILAYLGLAEARSPAKKPSFIRRLLGARDNVAERPQAVPEGAVTDEGAEEVDLDKAWHALHFLYAGAPWEGEPPNAFLLNGGVAIGDEDVGYGPARAYGSSDIAAIHGYLSSVDDLTLRSAYNPETLSREEIYPTIWSRESDGNLEYVLEYHHILKDFIARCVKGSWGMVTYLA